MGYSRKTDIHGITVTHCHGIITIQEAIASLKDLANYVRKDNTLFEIILHHKDSNIEIDYKGAQMLIIKARRFFEKLSAGYLAFVGTDDKTYGVCRQLAAQIESEKIKVEVFRTENTAREWILKYNKEDSSQ